MSQLKPIIAHAKFCILLDSAVIHRYLYESGHNEHSQTKIRIVYLSLNLKHKLLPIYCEVR